MECWPCSGRAARGEIDKFQNHNEQIALLYCFCLRPAVLRTQLLKSLWDPNLVPEVSIRGCRRSWSSLSYCCAANASVPCCFYELTTGQILVSQCKVTKFWAQHQRCHVFYTAATQPPGVHDRGGQVAAHGMLANINNDAQVLLHAPSTYSENLDASSSTCAFLLKGFNIEITGPSAELVVRQSTSLSMKTTILVGNIWQYSI